MQALLDLPSAQSCRLLSFENAHIVSGFVNGTYQVVVSGNAPCFNMDVQLLPRIHIRRPEWWAIEVVGCLPGVCLTAVRPYMESLPLQGLWGTLGIEVIGATGTRRFEKPADVP